MDRPRRGGAEWEAVVGKTWRFLGKWPSTACLCAVPCLYLCREVV